MKAMIFAAGLGTRLKPLTDNMPKALVPVAGQPLLGHLIDKLTRYGYDDIVVNVHHFADMIEEYLCSREKIFISNERDLLRDTGGGLLHARELLEGSEHFLVHNVDVVSNLDFGAFAAGIVAGVSGGGEEPLSTVVVSRRETSRYLLFDGEMRLVGWKNVATGDVKSPFLPGGKAKGDSLAVKNCPQLQDTTALAFAGIHYISDMIFPLLETYAVSLVGASSQPRDEVFSIIDFYLAICGNHCIKGFAPADFRMVDAGKISSLPAAEALLRTEGR